MAGIVGVILAGGLSRRMGGGDKALRPLGGQTVLARVVERVAAQVDGVLLNANGDASRFGEGFTVVADALPDHQGPLAGLLAGLDYVAANRPGAEWVLSVPADSPFLPRDLVDRLFKGRGRSAAAVASSGGRIHPVIGLWRLSTRSALRQLLASGERRVTAFATRVGAATVPFPASAYDPFFNVNTPGDLDEAARLLQDHPDA